MRKKGENILLSSYYFLLSSYYLPTISCPWIEKTFGKRWNSTKPLLFYK